MKGYKDFVIELPEKWSQTFKTESGIELHADRRHSIKRLANTIVEVKELPINYEGSIKNGDTILIDPTVVMSQNYVKGGEQENINLIDRNKRLYKVDPSLIIMHKSKGAEWIGYGDNTLLERLEVETNEIVSNLIISNPGNKLRFEKDRGIVAYPNPEMMSQEVYKGQTVIFNPKYSVDFWFGDKQFIWTKNRHLFAMVTETA